MTWQLQLIVAGIYLYASGDFLIRREWPWGLVFLCYSVATLALIWAQPKGND